MTALSVNLNKIALLRNSRGRDYPNVIEYGNKLIDLGVHGLTVHPRQDERHATRKDTRELAELCRLYQTVEFNVEGYPSPQFMQLISETEPDQCTLVPDAPDQLTSDHGWDLNIHFDWICALANELKQLGVRSSLFIDPDLEQIKLASKAGVDRIELYTEAYASAYASGGEYKNTLGQYAVAAKFAQSMGLGVNAGHDLDLQNLSDFLTIDDVLEVSIGHALTVESLDLGVAKVIEKYLAICAV